MKEKRINQFSKLKKNVKGITLIALVVTVIVLLILAGVAINLTIGENGIFSRAQNAKKTWENAERNEQIALGEGADIINEYLNGNIEMDDNTDVVEGKSLGDITGEETENTETKDKYGNPITVPAGFKVVNPNDDVTKGIVIEDVKANGENSKTVGSQFVWIPIGDVKTDDMGSTTKIVMGRYNFNEEAIMPEPTQLAKDWNQEVPMMDVCLELETSDYGNVTAKNLKDFITKSLSRGGYYIGRYEAGDADATDFRTDSAKTDNDMVCKAGAYPYNYLTQSQASNLCQSMYNSSKFESDLINSYAWDTAIVFIQTFSGDTDYSKQKPVETEIARCGEIDDVRCNIYDMAGNVFEWSTETSTNSGYNCVFRGGSYELLDFTAGARYNFSTSYSNYNSSCRSILYL